MATEATHRIPPAAGSAGSSRSDASRMSGALSGRRVLGAYALGAAFGVAVWGGAAYAVWQLVA